MFVKKNVFLLFLCVSSFGLAGQVIDLGGEDTAVGPLLPPPDSQVYDPTPWATAYSQEGSINITPPDIKLGSKYTYALTDRPGEIIEYEDLNILFFLEDNVTFKKYFLHRAYEKKKFINNDNSDLVIFRYPIVRPYLAGSLSYADNPRHIPMVKSELDSQYNASYNEAMIIRSLYELALEMPFTPTDKPRYLFDESRSLFDEEVPKAIEELELTIREKMMIEYGKINSRTSRSADMPIASWSESDLAAVVSRVSRATVNRKGKRIIKALVVRMSEKLDALEGDKDALSAAYAFYREMLSEQEQIWLEWVIKNSDQIAEDLNVTLAYLNGVNELPVNATNYAHFFNTTLLLRETLRRVRSLPKEAEARLVLDQLTAIYQAKVKADMITFEGL